MSETVLQNNKNGQQLNKQVFAKQNLEKQIQNDLDFVNNLLENVPEFQDNVVVLKNQQQGEEK